ncbi:MAG: class I SAM-dependent methyltransferase [Candidatus Bathyarchaeia archaeon]
MFYRKVFFKKYVFKIYEHVYEPAEDSILFAENLKVDPGSKVLDMGTGCGILGIIAAEEASSVIAVDINPYAVACARENAKINGVYDKMFFIRSDLFKAIRNGEKFDLIMFNAPYLPAEPAEDVDWIQWAWSGGPDGRAVIDRFLKSFPTHLAEGGRMLLMQSTLSNVDKTLEMLKAEGFAARIIAEKSLPLFETITLIEAYR